MNSFENSKTIAIINSTAGEKLKRKLAEGKNKIFEIPDLKIAKTKPTGLKNLDRERIGKFDWLICTDILAAEFFLEHLTETGFDLFDLDDLRICSMGETVSDRFRFYQVHSDVIPNDLAPEQVIKDLANYIGDEEEFARLRFLIITGEAGGGEILELLKRKKAVVLRLAVYQIEQPDRKQLSRLKTLLIGGAVDEFYFTTPKDFFILEKSLGRQDLQLILNNVHLTAADQTTLQVLFEQGFSARLKSV